MASSILIPVLVTLLAPAEAAAAPTAPSEAAPAPAPAPGEGEAATDPSASPEAAPTAATAPEASPLAPAPEPSDAPPLARTATVPAPTPIPPPPPRPIRWRLDIGAGVGSNVVADRGLRAFADRRNLPEVGVSAVFDFCLAGSRFFVGGGLAYQYTGRTGDAYGTQLLTEIDLHEPQVLGRASFMAVEGVDAFARVGVGPSFSSMGFTSDGHEGAEQTTVIPRVDSRAGLSLSLPRGWLPRTQAARVTAGLELSLGYTWRGTLDVRPDLAQGQEPLRATTVPWGELTLHGLSWGVGVFVRVM